MQSNPNPSRTDQLNHLSETAVNGRVIHKMDLIGIVRICGVHYFNIYRRYNSVYEIIVEDSNGEFYLQRDTRLRNSIGKVLCLTEQQINSMYSVELYSFRHGGTPPTFSLAPENMSWSEIHREWCAVEINLRGILEEYHAFVNQFYSQGDSSDNDTSDNDTSDNDSDVEEDDQDLEEDEDEYADMPPLISDSEDEGEDEGEDDDDDDDECVTPLRNTIIQPPNAPSKHVIVEVHLHPEDRRELAESFRALRESMVCKRSYEEMDEEYESDQASDHASDQESDCECYRSADEAICPRGCGPDQYTILRNGTKYRKVGVRSHTAPTV